jgi:Ulp1 family protease
LIFDSLPDISRSLVVDTLRDYLQREYQVKRPVEAATQAYDKAAVKGYHLNVPLQDNGHDCGLYVLKFAESFIKVSVEISKEKFY